MSQDLSLTLFSRLFLPVQIIDFGMSKFVKRRQYFHSLRGTPYYIAPEVIKGQYNESCDVSRTFHMPASGVHHSSFLHAAADIRSLVCPV
jgi:serine/threonine protein kinase